MNLTYTMKIGKVSDYMIDMITIHDWLCIYTKY